MSVKLNPVSTIKADLGIQEGGPIHAFFTNECYKAMDKYVPMSDKESRGNLRTIVDIQTSTITYESPYARYQYYGIREDGTHAVNNYTTPGTGPYWDKRMWSVEKDKIIEKVQKKINSGGK